MIKTVASVKREIEKLSKEREAIYAEILHGIDKKIEVNRKWIKDNCNHNEDNLIIEEIYEEDEYGQRCPSWDKWVIKCSVCGKFATVNKDKFKAGEWSFDEVLDLSPSELEKLQ